MAYDANLDARIQDVVLSWGATRKMMFGGTGYMLNGNLLAGVHGDRLIVRLGAADGEAALEEPGVAPFDMTRRPMAGWVTVGQDQLGGSGLLEWLTRARTFVASLPSK